MRIVVLGGTGLIGAQVVELLRADGHDAVAASRSTGVDVVAGTGLDEVLAGADAVVDTLESSAFDEESVVAFYGTTTRNALDAGIRAGVRHHVALSIVGVDRDPDARGYLAGKVRQERLLAEAPVPVTIVRATQFFEFLHGIAEGSVVDGAVRVAPVLLQPVASRAVARAVAVAATAPAPEAGVAVIEIAGPVRAPLAEFLERVTQDDADARPVVTDPGAGYFGRAVGETSLVPVGEAQIDALALEEWLAARDISS